MSKEPLVSILTLIFNHRPYVGQTIRSVLRQTYQNWEWIILDDGSTDGTADIVKGIQDRRIKYVFQENAGFFQLAKNYNKCLGLSNGELVAMLDGDDYWPDYKLEVQIRGFDDTGIVFSYGECCLVNQEGKEIGHIDLPGDAGIAGNNPVGSSLELFLKVSKLNRYLALHDSTVMIRKDVLLNVGGFVEANGAQSDSPTWTRLSLEGRFCAVPMCLGYWRRHPSCGSFRADQVSMFDAGLDFLREFILEHRKRLDELGLSYDVGNLEKHWEKVRREFIAYRPYNRAMMMLSLGSFKEAKAEFKMFQQINSSFKHAVIYALITFSAAIRFDIVHPLLTLKGKLKKFRDLV